MQSRSPDGRRREESSTVKIDICIITYRRPRGLQRLLGGLQQQRLHEPVPELRILVVDNDPEESARSVCEQARGWLDFELIYEVEKRRGIPQARNAALALAIGRADFVAFIDDDEVPEPDWLAELCDVQRIHEADAVGGPVLPLFETPPPVWIERGGFFDRARFETGTRLGCGYTNNLFVSVRALASLDRLFDERMALTGSSDTELFERFARRGHRIVWADAAQVVEWMPASRVNLRWLLQRSFRIGTASVIIDRVCREDRPRAWRMLAHAGWCIARGALQLPRALAGNRVSAAEGLRLAALGLGRCAGLAGYRYQEYRQIHGE
jgi:glycosyltransferase involved in cell wall biosynthesis